MNTPPSPPPPDDHDHDHDHDHPDERGRQLNTLRLFFFYLPETSMLRRFRFQLVVASRFLSEVGQEGVFYGSLVQVARDGSAFQASLIGVARVLPGATLGLIGGAVADALPRRIAIGLGYMVQASFCIVLPFVFGTGFGTLLMLVFGVSALNQLINPSEKAVLPLVSKREELSSAASIMSLSDSIATGVGTAAVAPLVLALFGVRALFILCGVFLVLASVRIIALPIQKDVTVRAALRRLNLSELDIGFTAALRWLIGWPAIVTIIMVGMVVTVLARVTETLGPTYVAEVLGADPARSVYVFAPAGLGALAALAVTPWVLDRLGERVAAAIAVLIMCLALFAMAFMSQLAPILGPISPTNFVRLFGLHPTDALLAASFLSLFTGFAISMSSVSVQTYVNRRVPMVQQGRVFGLESVLASGAALIPMLLLGVFADLTSIETILFFAPWIALGGVYALLVLASRWTGAEPMSRSQVVSSFWSEPEHDPAHISEAAT